MKDCGISGCNHPEGECLGMCLNSEEPEPVGAKESKEDLLVCTINGCNFPNGPCSGGCAQRALKYYRNSNQPHHSSGKQDLKRRQILEDAIRCVCHDRQDQHGSPENTFAMISDLWEIYLSHKHNLCAPLHPTDVAQMMVLFKIARSALGKLKDDDFVDEAGYAALAGELCLNRRSDMRANA